LRVVMQDRSQDFGKLQEKLLAVNLDDALKRGTKDNQRIELMTQWLSSFEIANAPRADHLIPRLEIMYRVLLRDPAIKEKILKKTLGLDLEAEFSIRLGVSLDHWLFIVFTLYGYFLSVGSALAPDASYMMINPQILKGDSAISQNDLATVLAILSDSPQALREKNGAQ
jgi:hypothetical protein